MPRSLSSNPMTGGGAGDGKPSLAPLPIERNNQVSTVEFGTAPTRARRDLARKQAQELRSRPGEEGKIRTYPREKMKSAHSYANHIRSGRIPAFKGCDAWATTVGDEVQVWARYGIADHEAVTP